MKFLDTNIFIRHLTRDDEAKAQACFALFRNLESGDDVATTSESVFSEVVYVLSSRVTYNLQPDVIRQLLLPILGLRGLRLDRKAVFLRALELYEQHPQLDFEDALTVAHVENDGIEDLVSYDRGFDRVAGLKRIEPPTSASDPVLGAPDRD